MVSDKPDLDPHNSGMETPQIQETDPPGPTEERPQHTLRQSVSSTDQESIGTDEAPATSPVHSNGYSNGQRSHHSPRSSEHIPSNPSSSQHDGDHPSRCNSSTTAYQQQTQPSSRPSSGLSSGGDRYGYPQSSYQEQNQRQQPQQAKNSVVIKVGMVGDAQIGKTSLMVKYVEGSWDEDYIQTLGKSEYLPAKDPGLISDSVKVSILWRRPFQSGIQKSLSRSGTLVGSGNLSTCFRLSATMQLPFCSCLISPGRVP